MTRCVELQRWTEQGIKKLEARDNESGRNVPESLEKKVQVVRTCHAMRKDEEYVGERVRCGGEEKENKIEAEQ